MADAISTEAFFDVGKHVGQAFQPLGIVTKAKIEVHAKGTGIERQRRRCANRLVVTKIDATIQPPRKDTWNPR